MRDNLIIVCLLSSLSLPVCGQSTLEDCIHYAWKHNPGFKNVQIDVKEARTDYVAAMGKFLPHVSVQAEVGRHIGRSVDPDTNGYTADSYNQGTIGMDITLSLFEGFVRINRLRYTYLTKKEKEWDHLAKKNDLAYRVASFGRTLSKTDRNFYGTGVEIRFGLTGGESASSRRCVQRVFV